MKTTKKYNSLLHEFPSWGEFVNHAENAPIQDKDVNRDSKGMGRESFSGVKCFEDALKLAKEGWQEGLKEASSISKPILNHVSQMIERQNIIHDVEGHGIDVARYIEGEPECWMRFETEKLMQQYSAGKLIRIVFNRSVSAGIAQDVIIAKGAAIGSLIELLEYSGNRVSLEVVYTSGFLNFFSETRVIVKEMDENMDMSKIIYVLAHPSSSRSIWMSFAETFPIKFIRGLDIGHSYGSPRESRHDKGDIYIGRSSFGEPSWKDKKSTEEWIIKTLQEQGVKIKIGGN